MTLTQELAQALRTIIARGVFLSYGYLDAFKGKDWPPEKAIHGFDKARWLKALEAYNDARAVLERYDAEKAQTARSVEGGERFADVLAEAQRIAPFGQGGESSDYIRGWRDVLEFIARSYADPKYPLERALGSGEAAPVAWIVVDANGEYASDRCADNESGAKDVAHGCDIETKLRYGHHKAIPVYAAPPHPTPSAWRRACEEAEERTVSHFVHPYQSEGWHKALAWIEQRATEIERGG